MSTPEIDVHHGRGGSYVRLPDGSRVQVDPHTGEPLNAPTTAAPTTDAAAEPPARRPRKIEE